MFRYISAGLAVAVGIGSMVYAQEPLIDSSAAPAAPAAQTVQVKQEQAPAQVKQVAPAPEAKSSDEQLADLKGKVDGLDESYAETKSTVAGLSKIKISGYVQAQYKSALTPSAAKDSTGKYKYNVGDFAGGTLPSNVGGMFQVRRGRVKIVYDNGVEQAAVQLDCTPSSVGIKEAWAGLKDPWIKTIGIRAGVIDRPIGFEPVLSSGSRESPEESRMIQTLLPDDYDLGANLEILPSEKTSALLQYFTGRIGVFTGNGIANETDNNLDVIGRLGFSVPFNDINFSIDGGVSGYSGSVTNTDSVGSGAKLPMASRGFSYSTINDSMVKSSGGDYGKTFTRQYTDVDLQLYFGNVPVIGGLTLRGEYIQGKQPGSASSSKSSNATSVTANLPVYERNFMGYYAEWIQNFDPLNSQFILKYDIYDPNTDVSGTDIKKAKGFSAADVKFSTLGIGWSYFWSANVKLTAYWDLVHNEKTDPSIASNGVQYSTDLMDNVFTLRMQYKF
ncbi:MAG: hypothetical protein ABSF80_01260 [Chitinispirillaceae bacterium]